jgi:hypothetical protein
MLAHEEIVLQKQLFPIHDSFLDEGGYLTKEASAQIKEIEKTLRGQKKNLEDVTQISRETWNNWLYRRRPPSGAALAFLTIFLIRPKMVLDTLEFGVQKDEELISAVQ